MGIWIWEALDSGAPYVEEGMGQAPNREPLSESPASRPCAAPECQHPLYFEPGLRPSPWPYELPEVPPINSLSVQFSSVQSLSRVRLFGTPWITACQASLSVTNSRSLPYLLVGVNFYACTQEPWACGILVPQSGIEHTPSQWKHRVLTTGPPGKSPILLKKKKKKQFLGRT